MGEGTSPSSTIRPDLRRGSGTGIAESSAWVYGCLGSRYRSRLDAISTRRPRYMTPTVSLTCWITARSWAINRKEMP